METMSRSLTGIISLIVFFCAACSTNSTDVASADIAQTKATESDARKNIYIVGQDLDALRGYFSSKCCVHPDGTTAYIGLYNVFSEEEAYGGLGLGPDGKPSDVEANWGAGATSAYKIATEFGVDDLAIGLFIAENDRPNAMEELVAGYHDDKIRHLAKLFKYVPGVVYLRIGYEFDGNWNQGYENTEEFVAGWRRIVDVLRTEGVENVEYVWHTAAAAVDDIVEKKHEDLADWYPGDDYVDWVGISWFTDGIEAASVETEYDAPTFGDLAREAVAFARDKNKPVMLAETSPQGYDIANLTNRHHSGIWDGEPGTGTRNLTAEELWEEWFDPFFAFLDENDDVVRAIAYINVNWDAQSMWGPPYASGYWGDTRIEANPLITERWNAAITAWRGE